MRVFFYFSVKITPYEVRIIKLSELSETKNLYFLSLHNLYNIYLSVRSRCTCAWLTPYRDR